MDEKAKGIVKMVLGIGGAVALALGIFFMNWWAIAGGAVLLMATTGCCIPLKRMGFSKGGSCCGMNSDTKGSPDHGKTSHV